MSDLFHEANELYMSTSTKINSRACEKTRVFSCVLLLMVIIIAMLCQKQIDNFFDTSYGNKEIFFIKIEGARSA